MRGRGRAGCGIARTRMKTHHATPRHFGGVLGALILLLSAGSGAENLSEYGGARLYQRFCASCHGERGHGDGPVADSLKVMVPDLTRIARRHGGAFPSDQIRRIIDGRAVQPPHGSREMPVWGYEFRSAGADDPGSAASADELIERLLEFLTSIQVK
jgi:mono/diheme cytochrome c family protein